MKRTLRQWIVGLSLASVLAAQAAGPTSHFTMDNTTGVSSDGLGAYIDGQDGVGATIDPTTGDFQASFYAGSPRSININFSNPVDPSNAPFTGIHVVNAAATDPRYGTFITVRDLLTIPAGETALRRGSILVQYQYIDPSGVPHLVTQNWNDLDVPNPLFSVTRATENQWTVQSQKIADGRVSPLKFYHNTGDSWAYESAAYYDIPIRMTIDRSGNATSFRVDNPNHVSSDRSGLYVDGQDGVGASIDHSSGDFMGSLYPGSPRSININYSNPVDPSNATFTGIHVVDAAAITPMPGGTCSTSCRGLIIVRDILSIPVGATALRRGYIPVQKNYLDSSGVAHVVSQAWTDINDPNDLLFAVTRTADSQWLVQSQNIVNGDVADLEFFHDTGTGPWVFESLAGAYHIPIRITINASGPSMSFIVDDTAGVSSDSSYIDGRDGVAAAIDAVGDFHVTFSADSPRSLKIDYSNPVDASNAPFSRVHVINAAGTTGATPPDVIIVRDLLTIPVGATALRRGYILVQENYMDANGVAHVAIQNWSDYYVPDALLFAVTRAGDNQWIVQSQNIDNGDVTALAFDHETGTSRVFESASATYHIPIRLTVNR